MPADHRITSLWGRSDCHTLESYLGGGGYDSLKKALQIGRGEVLKYVQRPCIDGRGGAHFPTGKKWSFMKPVPGKPTYLVVNADEGEPGTFKDRYIMEKSPHHVVEGMAIAAYTIGAAEAFIYIRGEYPVPFERITGAVAEARAAGYLGDDILGSGYGLKVTVMRGAGAYICGEETAMLSSIEGEKGFPRLKPPFPAVSGLFGCPTLVDNVETLAYIPSMLSCEGDCGDGGRTPAELGCPAMFCVSGHVERPGVYEMPIGTRVRDLIDGPAGGVRGGRALKAVIPGGSSSGVLTAEEADTPMEASALARRGVMLGTAALVVLDETTDMVRLAHNLAEFYSHESCGQCTPCREGCDWLEKILGRIARGHGRREELGMIPDLCARMSGKTICAFAEGAAQAISSISGKFGAEFEARLDA